MLKRLFIKDFALVDKLETEFKSGLSVITGETGAGKSIIIGALSRLLGEKADKDDIRTGADLAIVEADFDISENRVVKQTLENFDIENDENTITFRKEIYSKRASKSFINGQLVNLTQLKSVTKEMAELFGQHSHQKLLDEKNHLAFLDQFAGISEEVEQLREIFNNWQISVQKLEKLVANKAAAQNERELLLFQKDEIEKAKIRIGEEEKILAEKKILDSSHILGEKCTAILMMLDQDENSSLNSLGMCRKEFTTITQLDMTLEKKAELLEQSIINLEELRGELESYLSSIPNDPERQEEINLRLDELYRLKKKYGGSEESILSALDEIKAQLERKIDIDQHIKILRNEESKRRQEYIKLALKISGIRKKTSKDLSRIVVRELGDLGIESAQFEFEIIFEDDPDGVLLSNRFVKPFAHGLESGRFLISANPGEPLKPLARTASGGEISRVMLALKASDKGLSNITNSLLVFDEIDSGIGGQTANMVANKLAALSNRFQLLVVTHLHQIAAIGEHHLAVEKTSSDIKSGRSVITMRELKTSERKKEINRMISLPLSK